MRRATAHATGVSERPKLETGQPNNGSNPVCGGLVGMGCRRASQSSREGCTWSVGKTSETK